MKIALVCDAFYPSITGVTTVIDFYGRYMGREHDVYMVCARPRAGEDISKNIAGAPYKMVYCDIGRMNIQQQYRNCLCKKDKKFQAEIAAIPFDIIHVHSYFPLGNWMRDYGRKHGIPVVATLHNKIITDFDRYDKTKIIAGIITRMIVRGFEKYDMVYSLNEGMVRLIKRWGFRKETRIIESGADFRPLAVDSPEVQTAIKSTRKELGVPQDCPMFLFVGRLIAPKGIMDIARALAILKKRGQRFKMVYVGNGPEERKLHKLVGRLKLADDVIFLGAVYDRKFLQNIYASADLFLFPSPYDTEGLVKIEAAAYETPTLGYEGSIAASNIQHGVNGFTSRMGVKHLADAIADAISNPERLANVGRAAKATIYKHWDDCAEKMLLEYRRVIDAKKLREE